MKRQDTEVIDYYNNEVVKMISDKYDLSPMKAFKQFTMSTTHKMLENVDYGMSEFGAGAVFEIWECEQITGDPRNSIYIRGE